MEDQRVRERLVHQGVACLNDAELLSIVIREGGGGRSAKEIAERLLMQNGGTAQLARLEFKTLRMAEGIGTVRAASLAAAFELGRRMAQSNSGQLIRICNNQDVEDIFRPQLSGLAHEEFWVLFLSAANTVVGREKVGQGGVSGVPIDPRLVVKRAVELLSSSMILVHNHPSGVAEPSGDDRAVTSRIADAARLFDIDVVDHLIITGGECFSFRQAGLIG